MTEYLAGTREEGFLLAKSFKTVNPLWEEGLSVEGSSPTEVPRRWGLAAQLFHALENQKTETYLVYGPHPEVDITFKACSRGLTSASEATVSGSTS